MALRAAVVRLVKEHFALLQSEREQKKKVKKKLGDIQDNGIKRERESRRRQRSIVRGI